MLRSQSAKKIQDEIHQPLPTFFQPTFSLGLVVFLAAVKGRISPIWNWRTLASSGNESRLPPQRTRRITPGMAGTPLSRSELPSLAQGISAATHSTNRRAV